MDKPWYQYSHMVGREGHAFDRAFKKQSMVDPSARALKLIAILSDGCESLVNRAPHTELPCERFICRVTFIMCVVGPVFVVAGG
jgi:hypothetical protein